MSAIAPPVGRRHGPLMLALLWALSLSLGSYSTAAGAHAFSPSVLRLQQFDEQVFEVQWKVPAKQVVRTTPRLPVTCARISGAEKSIEGTGKLATWKIHCPDGLIGGDLGVSFTGAGKDRASAFVQVEFLDNYSISEIVTANNPTFSIAEKPGKLEVGADYLRLGVEHILMGFDHLLFVLGLLLLVGVNRQLLWTVTAFTLGHSITLGIAALELLTLPQAPVEALIAFSIYVLGIEIIRSNRGRESWFKTQPWLVAGGFGLLHGLGFAGALAEIGLPAHEIPMALFAFNLGIELGQLAFIAVVLLCWGLLHSLNVQWPVAARQLPAYVIGGCAAFWTIERSLSLLA